MHSCYCAIIFTSKTSVLTMKSQMKKAALRLQRRPSCITDVCVNGWNPWVLYSVYFRNECEQSHCSQSCLYVLCKMEPWKKWFVCAKVYIMKGTGNRWLKTLTHATVLSSSPDWLHVLPPVRPKAKLDDRETGCASATMSFICVTMSTVQ